MSSRADVSEDAAHEHQVSGHGSGVPTAQRGVALLHPYPISEPRLRRPAPGERHQRRIELDEQCLDLGRPWMGGQYVDHIAALAGAEADDPDRLPGIAPRTTASSSSTSTFSFTPTRDLVERAPHHLLHQAQPLRKR